MTVAKKTTKTVAKPDVKAPDAAALAAAEAEAAQRAEAEAREREAQAEAEALAQAARDAAPAGLVFPREMKVVNATAQAWVVRRHVEPASTTIITVRDEDDLKRLRTDCDYILSLSEYYKPVAPAEGEEAAPHALRVVEVDDQDEA